MPKQKCSIPECFAGVNSASYTVTEYNKPDLKVCAKHKGFFEGHSGVNDESIVDRCSDCDTGFKLIEEDSCSACNNKAFPVCNRSLDLFIKVMKPVYKKLKVFDGDSNLDTDEVNRMFLLLMKTSDTYEDALDKMQTNFLGKEKEVIEPRLKTRKPSLSILVEEAQQAAFSVATKKLIEKIQNQLPNLFKILGLSEDKAEKLHGWVTSNLGSIVISGLLSTIATFVPLPAQYEQMGAKIAEQLRKQTMDLIGSSSVDIISSLFTADVVKEVKESISTFEQIVKPVEIVHEVTA